MTVSRPSPEREYNRKPLTKLIKWSKGEEDTFLGNLEARKQRERRINKTLLEKYKQDQQKVIDEVFDQEHNWVYKAFKRLYKILSIVCCLALITILVVAVSYLPQIGSAENPTINEVSNKYLTDSIKDTGAVNTVTGMILDYRAFDTFGESNVLFIATCTVLIMLRNDKKNKKSSSEEYEFEPKEDSILQKITFVLFPVIIIFGIYVILNGHLSPGGGFSGGAIIGAGLVLYANAYGFEKLNRFFTEKTYKTISFSALTFYCLAKSYSFYTGANHIESIIPLGKVGAIISSGLILPLNICVGLVVASTMYAFFALFRKGGL